MNSAVKDLSQSLGCSELVARELIVTGLEVAQAFGDFRDVWGFELMLEAKRMVSKQWSADYDKVTKNPPFLGSQNELNKERVKRTRRKLSSAGNKMFKQFEAAEAAWQKFRLAQYQVTELRNIRNQELLTTTFEMAHEHRQLPQPEKVIEGRTLFEAMWRDSELLRQVGATPLLD